MADGEREICSRGGMSCRGEVKLEEQSLEGRQNYFCGDDRRHRYRSYGVIDSHDWKSMQPASPPFFSAATFVSGHAKAHRPGHLFSASFDQTPHLVPLGLPIIEQFAAKYFECSSQSHFLFMIRQALRSNIIKCYDHDMSPCCVVWRGSGRAPRWWNQISEWVLDP